MSSPIGTTHAARAVIAPSGLVNGCSSCARRQDIPIEHSEIPQRCSGTLLAPIRYNEHVPREKAMNIPATGIKLTYDDFLRFPDDGKRHELIGREDGCSGRYRVRRAQQAARRERRRVDLASVSRLCALTEGSPRDKIAATSVKIDVDG